MSTTEPTYRKTKNGTWVAFGPVAAFKETVRTPEGPDTITVDYIGVRKRDGQIERRRVESLGKPFMADGVECCYAYLAYSPPDRPRRRSREDYLDEYGCGHPEFNGVDMCTRCMYSPM